MQDAAESTSEARYLWAAARHGVLGTQSAALPGYPFGSVVPFVLGRDGEPLLLLSPLSQHTRNIEQEPRCCLTLKADEAGDVQQHARLTALGELRRTEPESDAERYFRYFPQARDYHASLGFHFYRLDTIRMHWNGGFATARWIGPERIVRPNPLEAATEARIIEHMNADHQAALRTYLGPSVSAHVDPGQAVEMLGIDADGMDLRHAGDVIRVRLASPIDSAESARKTLVEMAQSTP
ncbi:MAG: DUF2470 domain-containing protein [Chromatiaceae bacterium]|jgi:hypothetical protein